MIGAKYSEEMAIEQADFEVKQYACPCLRFERFGTVHDYEHHYGIIISMQLSPCLLGD